MTYDCWYRTKIDVDNALNVDWKLPDNNRSNIWHISAEEIFSKEWLSYMTSIRLPIHSAMVFYKRPHEKIQTAHVDLTSRDIVVISNIGFNWVLSGEDSDMVWYDLPKQEKQINHTTAKTPYWDWNVTELTEIDRCKIQKNNITVVNPGLPHTIEVGREGRWGISARINLPYYIPYEVFIDYMKNSNLLIPR